MWVEIDLCQWQDSDMKFQFYMSDRKCGVLDCQYILPLKKCFEMVLNKGTNLTLDWKVASLFNIVRQK